MARSPASRSVASRLAPRNDDRSKFLGSGVGAVIPTHYQANRACRHCEEPFRWLRDEATPPSHYQPRAPLAYNLTYSYSKGSPLMPDLGLPIQFAIFPGSVTACITERT